MGRVKIKKKSTFIDMTAMSDVTVLLLTFFMLTSTFVKPEPVKVNTPGSVSEIKIPETDILQILIAPDGKVFMSMDRQSDLEQVLTAMGDQYGIQFTAEQINKFKTASTFGVPMKSMKGFLDLEEDKQNEVLKTAGIPCDSLDNQFKDWVRNARSVNRDLRIAIKADAATPYSTIKNVMNSLQDLHENRYNLITSLKTMLCTTLSKPQTMEISMPSNDKNITDEERSKVKASQAITLLLAGEDKLYYYEGEPKYDDFNSLKESSYQADGLRAMLLRRNSAAVRQVNELKQQKADLKISEEEYDKKVSEIKGGDGTPTVIIKATDDASYKNLIDALDEMQICNIGKYVIADIAEGDEFLIKNFESKGAYGAENLAQ